MLIRRSDSDNTDPAQQYMSSLEADRRDNIQDSWTISISENVLHQQLGDVEGEIVLLDMQNGGYFGLNDVGSRIWCLIQEGNPVGSIIDALTKEYDAPEQELRADLEQFLTELGERGLIQVNETGSL